MQFSKRAGDFGTLALIDGAIPRLPQIQASKDEIIGHLKSSGYVFFSGAKCSINDFEAVTDEFAHSTTTEHRALHGSTRDVYVERPFLNLHSELHYTAWPPDLISFYCLQPAATGGRTNVCDGMQFYQLLSPSTREYFHSQRLMYTQFFSPGVWPKRMRVSTAEELPAALDYPGLSYELTSSGALKLCYKVSAYVKTRHQDEFAFVNTLLHGLDDMHFYGVTMEDGTPVDPSVVKELSQLAEKLTVPLPWQSGDMVIIDNSRLMHGREAYSDQDRRIGAKHGMARYS
jgi:hypothetical protein